MDPRMQQNRRSFFGEQNEALLYSMLSKNFQERLGSPLTEKQSSRLERGLEHYMSEVFQANSSLPVQSLNKEVLAVTASDFNDYLQRQDSLREATPQVFQETSQRYDQLQQDRQRSMEQPRPAVPDYVQPMVIKEDDSVTALSLFEEAKKRRNMETSVQAEEQLARRSASSLQPLYLENTQEQRPDPRVMFDRPLDMVLAGQTALSGRGDVNPTLARPGPTVANRGVLQQDMIIKQEDIQSYKETEYNLAVYSADRNWELDINNSETRFNFTVNLNSSSSSSGVSLMPKAANRFKNIVRIEFIKAIVPIEATEMMVRKIGSAKTPNNIQSLIDGYALALTTINAGNTTAITAANTAISNLQTLQGINGLLTPGVISYDTSYIKSVYSYPFITLNIDELDTNTYGTSNSMDNAFGILQYDSNWTDNTDSLGFTSLIPKHMKCQRIYSPTPLSTLNKLTIRLQQPNGNLINPSPDTLDISGIFLSSAASMRPYFSNTMDLSGSVYYDTDGDYIWLDCEKWFGRYQFAVGDKIQIKNLKCSAPTSAINDLIDYLQDTDGLPIVGTAWSRLIAAGEITRASLTVNQITTGVNNTLANYLLVDGFNQAGYARYIILRGKFNDPTNGSTSISPYGKAANNTTLSTAMLSGSTKIVPGKLINLSRQTQLIFRVITREYDPTSLVRADNL
jgi:hypothetical protein